jgi:hypothetical protein
MMPEEIQILKGNAAKLVIGKVSGIPKQERKDIDTEFERHPPSTGQRAHFEDNFTIREKIYQCFANRAAKYVDDGITEERVNEIFMDALSMALYCQMA